MRMNRWLAISALPFLTMACAKSDQAAPASATATEVAATATAMPVPADPAAAAAREEKTAGGAAAHGGAPAAPTMMAKPKRAADDAFGLKDESDKPAFGLANQQGFSGVKAGEWDDNANYREFMKFLGQGAHGAHAVDLRDRRFLVVRDSKGQPMPHCKVTVQDMQQRSTSFVTTASGRAIMFPRAEGMHDGKLVATANCGDDATARATFGFGSNEPSDALVDLKTQATRKPIGMKTVDVAFVLDTTGSMSEEITAVKATIQRVAQSLSNDQTQVRIGMVEYKDRSDAFVTKAYPFTTDLAGFSRKVASISAGGGGDTPEDMNAGLHAALDELQWSDQSVARMAFVIADAPPHLDYQGPDYANDMKRASHRGIQLFTVAASGMDDLGQVVFRQMAQFTGATNMFVLRGGAGPQSTGGGDPKSSCGGTHTNYSSGKLDELIVQKIRRELKSLDADPMRIAGLEQDENAKPCDQRVVWKD